MPSNIRTKLTAVAAIAGAAIGGAAIANAATSSSSTSSSTPSQTQQPYGQPPQGGQAPQGQPPQGGRPQGRHTLNGKTEEPLSGDVAAKVKAAALAKVSGTVERVETNVDSSAPYEAHIKKSDGTEVEVQVNKDYTVAAVNTMGQHP